jgi:hypothetical protein
MPSWLTRLGRWSARTRELSPASRHAISWIASQPDAQKWLAPLMTETKRAPPVRRDAEREAEPSTPLSQITANAAELVRADHPVAHDPRWDELHAQGWMVEALQQVAKFAAQNNIEDPRVAAEALSRAAGNPEPASQSGGRHFTALDRRAAAAHDAAVQALLDGDDERWLDHSVSMALREARGG